MEHSQKLTVLYQQYVNQIDTTNMDSLAVPSFISIMSKCIHHKVSDLVIQNLHFNDLLLLLMKLDIQELSQALKMINSKSRKTQKNIKDISSDQAVKMLKGGA